MEKETAEIAVPDDGNAEQGSMETAVIGKNVTEREIRVVLMNSEDTSFYHEEVSLAADGQTYRFDTDSDIGEDGKYEIQAREQGICVTSLLRQGKHPVYAGTLEIRKEKEGLLLINVLPVEEYLKGVVPGEMPLEYEKEARKAQAVCARTYAYKQMEEKRREKYHADVDDSVECQVYLGMCLSEAAIEPVEETKGTVILKDGELIEAYYFSTSSGVTSTDEVWMVSPGANYLQSVACEYDEDSPWRKWTVTIPWSDILKHVKKELPGATEIKSIQVTKKSESGAVTGIAILTDQGTLEVEGEYDVRELLSPEGFMITQKNGEETEGGKLLPSACFSLEQTEEGVRLEGGGYGHGVGMSQNAANEMAREGFTFQEILQYFYKDIDIAEIYKDIDITDLLADSE